MKATHRPINRVSSRPWTIERLWTPSIAAATKAKNTKGSHAGPPRGIEGWRAPRPGLYLLGGMLLFQMSREIFQPPSVFL
jgi:hypothetical protein